MAKSKTQKEMESFVYEPEHLPELISHLFAMEAWCVSFRKFLVEQLELGVEIPGASLEPTTPQRAWMIQGPVLQKELIHAMKLHGKPAKVDDVAPRSLLSPAGAEKILGKAAFAEALSGFVHSPPTGSTALRLKKTT